MRVSEGYEGVRWEFLRCTIESIGVHESFGRIRLRVLECMTVLEGYDGRLTGI